MHMIKEKLIITILGLILVANVVLGFLLPLKEREEYNRIMKSHHNMR